MGNMIFKINNKEYKNVTMVKMKSGELIIQTLDTKEEGKGIGKTTSKFKVEVSNQFKCRT